MLSVFDGIDFERSQLTALRYWRLVENQVQKRKPLKVQKMPKKRGAYQPSSARIVGRLLLRQPRLLFINE
jgi:hypothetical protein